MTVESIILSQIKQDATTQPRLKIDMAIVEEYSDAMKTGAVFPPLDVFKIDDQFILVDGYHRLWAAQSAKIKKYPCEIHEGTIRDAILFASGVNATHGLRRSNEDKKRAVERLLVDPEWGKWSNVQIAKSCNVSEHFVRTLRGGTVTSTGRSDRRKPRKYTTKHGTTSTMDTGKIGKKKKPPYNATPQPGDFKSTEPVPEPKTLAQVMAGEEPAPGEQTSGTESDHDRYVRRAGMLNHAKENNWKPRHIGREELIAELTEKYLSETQMTVLENLIEQGVTEDVIEAILWIIDRFGEMQDNTS